MAFSTQRGRPRKTLPDHDIGTPELRLKHALRLTTEPIDLCLEKKLITQRQHWCGLHLRWLYTLRYGAPNVTTFYTGYDAPASGPKKEDEDWRMLREREYHEASGLLKAQRRYECVMRLAVFNERPAFLSSLLQARGQSQYALARELTQAHRQVVEGLELLTRHWCRDAGSPQSR